MRITSVSGPNVKGKPIDQALEIICKHCHDTAIQIMTMSNEIEDLKQKIYRLENR